MLGNSFKKMFGTRNEREIKRILPLMDKINAMEPAFEALSDEALREKTAEFQKRHAGGESLNALLPEAFAACREAAKRALGMRHFDVQLIGGWCMHQGAIAEMVTGEGKTLVATLAVYLNTLPNKGVHVVTVNDYLAKRDAQWVGPIYDALGLKVGFIQANMGSHARQRAYACDVTYGTNSEFGFDYLRDNMKVTRDLQVQRPLHFAVIDEVDSILIDEARTPLIITGSAEDESQQYAEACAVARQLKKDTHFEIKEKERQVILTEEGQDRCEELAGVNIFETIDTDWPHLIDQSLLALNLYKRDTHYVVKHGEVIIVDEFTGRLMDGRRWANGLHQAVEAKEGLKPKPETQTLATITYQNFFKLYERLAGMTGTAMTEAAEFWQIYKLDVFSVPTNRPLLRIEQQDLVYATEKEKLNSVIEEILRVNETGRPILVGTTTIEMSERLSGMLNRRGIEHVVLNAKHHEREAAIVAQAGQMGAVTIATNMAGRGTDIVLGEGIKERGGLHIIGTERHESRRIDNQLRGRSGRQGDPGSSQFFLSLEDDLMRIFAPEWVGKILTRLGLKDGEAIEAGMVTRAITKAQKKVEGRNFEIRKNLLEYDEVMDTQRKQIYKLRDALLDNDVDEQVRVIDDFLEQVVERKVDDAFGKGTLAGERDPEAMARWFRRRFGITCAASDLNPQDVDASFDFLLQAVRSAWKAREEELGTEEMRAVEHFLLMNAIDARWKDHLHAMDGLKTGIGLRGYGQIDPKVAYKVEGHKMFRIMLQGVREEVTDHLLRVRFSREAEQQLQERWSDAEAVAPPDGGTGVRASTGMSQPAEAGRTDDTPIGSNAGVPAAPIRRDTPKVGRNEPCPCGSGKKYKKCHGANE